MLFVDNATNTMIGISEVRIKNPNASFPEDLDRVDWAQFNVTPLTLLPEPAYNPAAQQLGAVVITIAGKSATGVRAVLPLSAADQAAYAAQQTAQAAAVAQHAADTAAKQSAQADVVIQYLVNHTPAECAAYVAANVTNLASAVSLLQKFAIALCVISKREFR